jgi:hypothetical protein
VEAAPGGGGGAVPDFSAAVAQASGNIAAGKGTLNDQATVMSGSAANLVASAGSGFKLDPDAATALIASCDESLKILEGMERDLQYIREAPKLGQTQPAQHVAQFTQAVANDPRGMVRAVENLRATINQMRDAYKKAVANYQSIEQQVTDSANKLASEVQRQNQPAPQHGRIRAV